VPEKKQLSGVLNLRVDAALAQEIDRIAANDGTSASEAARKLLAHGVEVARQIEASHLLLPYTTTPENTEGRIVIEAAWKPYTRRELWDIEDDREALISEMDARGR
jgi:hypothetical protein